MTLRHTGDLGECHERLLSQLLNAETKTLLECSSLPWTDADGRLVARNQEDADHAFQLPCSWFSRQARWRHEGCSQTGGMGLPTTPPKNECGTRRTQAEGKRYKRCRTVIVNEWMPQR